MRGRIAITCRLVTTADRLCTDVAADHSHVLLGSDVSTGHVIEKRYVTEATAREFCSRKRIFMPITAVVEPMPIVPPVTASDPMVADPSHDFRARAAGDVPENP